MRRSIGGLLAAFAMVMTTLSASPAQAAPITGLKCKYFSNGTPETSDNYEACIQVKYRMSRRAKLIFAHFVENDSSSGTVEGNCTSRETQTFRWGGSITASVEAKAWIFAKVSGSVTASFDKTRSTETSVSATFTVRPGKTKYCYYVEQHERFMTRQCLANAYSGGRQCEERVFIAPKREGWVISDDPMKF